MGPQHEIVTADHRHPRYGSMVSSTQSAVSQRSPLDRKYSSIGSMTNHPSCHAYPQQNQNSSPKVRDSIQDPPLTQGKGAIVNSVQSSIERIPVSSPTPTPMSEA